MIFLTNIVKCAKIHSVEGKNKFLKKLDEAHIEYYLKRKGVSAILRIGEIFWFDIYTKKKEYEKAKRIYLNLE